MPVTIQCPRLTCRAVLLVPEAVRGKRVRCAECGTTLLVPETPKRVAPQPDTATADEAT